MKSFLFSIAVLGTMTAPVLATSDLAMLGGIPSAHLSVPEMSRIVGTGNPHGIAFSPNAGNPGNQYFVGKATETPGPHNSGPSKEGGKEGGGFMTTFRLNGERGRGDNPF